MVLFRAGIGVILYRLVGIFEFDVVINVFGHGVNMRNIVREEVGEFRAYFIVGSLELFS